MARQLRTVEKPGQIRLWLRKNLLDTCNRLYFSVERNCPDPFPGITGVLASRRSAGIRLAVITNSAEEDARERLKILDFAAYFDAVVTPATFGVKKPNPLVYQKTLELLDVSPCDAIMIGDRLDRDSFRHGTRVCGLCMPPTDHVKKVRTGQCGSAGEILDILL